MTRAPLFPFSCSPGSFHFSPVVKILGFPRGLGALLVCWGYRVVLTPSSSAALSLTHSLTRTHTRKNTLASSLFSFSSDSSTARRDACSSRFNSRKLSLLLDTLVREIQRAKIRVKGGLSFPPKSCIRRAGLSEVCSQFLENT